MIILLNKFKIQILKEMLKENRVIFDFTKTDDAFFRCYGATKETMKAEILGLHKQIINAEKDIKNGVDEKMRQVQEYVINNPESRK